MIKVHCFYYSPYISKKIIASLLLIFCILSTASCIPKASKPIKIGILHSTTGTMAISEQSVVDATILAIDEINNAGGVLGRRLEPVLFDGASDWPTFAKGAEQLINKDKVDVVFGCWTSASRKMVKPIFESNDHLLFYPVQYEGLERSPNIIYTGAAPNQQISPAVKWSVTNLGKRVFLVASDYVFPRAANTQIKKQLKALNAELVGEYYLPLGNNNVSSILNALEKSDANVVINTINGDSNVAFFTQLQERRIAVPVMSFRISEDELQQFEAGFMAGHYAAWSYFQSLPTPKNREFILRFKERYGQDRTTSASMEAGYLGVHLWAKAATKANSVDASIVRQALKGESYDSPEGVVRISSSNNHLWKPLHIGLAQPNGQFKIMWSEDKPIRPLPYPSYRSEQYWQQYLSTLYEGWNKSWAAPDNSNDTTNENNALSQPETNKPNTNKSVQTKAAKNKPTAITLAPFIGARS